MGGFWPRRGPNWDALARVALPHPAVLVIEAKSHRSEMTSCYGGGRESVKIIEVAFHKTQQWLQPQKHREWKSPFYQFANRLAHLYFLRKNAYSKHGSRMCISRAIHTIQRAASNGMTDCARSALNWESATAKSKDWLISSWS